MNRRLVLLGFLLLALVVAGCGGASAGGDPSAPSIGEGASMVPADASLFLAVATDLGSDQAKKAQSLLDKFPGRDRLLTELQQELSSSNVDFEKDIKPVLGPEIDLTSFGFEDDDIVGLAKTDDQDGFIALLRKGDDPPEVIEKRDDGWVVFSDSQAAAARVGADGPKLADSASYKDATARLASDPLAIAYVDGPALVREASSSADTAGVGANLKLDWLAASLEAQDDGASVKIATKGASVAAPETYAPELLDHVPSGALLYASFKGADKPLQNALQQAGPATALVEEQLGVSPAALAALLSGEGALYAREGLPIPEVTLLLDGTNSAAKLATLTSLARKLVGMSDGEATLGTTTIGGKPFAQVKVGGVVNVYFGKNDDHIVVTDSTNAILNAGGGSSIADDPVFKNAKEASGMPDETSGFVYVNLKDGIPAVERLAGSAIPPDVAANLAPLRAVVLYAVPDGDVTTATLFVQIS